MNIFIQLLISLSVIFFTVGCQSNNSDELVIELPDENVTDPTDPDAEIISVILPADASSEITTNNEIVNIELTVLNDKNNHHSEGSVKIVYPEEIREGRDIGYFLPLELTPVEGKVLFVYNAPSNISKDDTDLVFKFYHDSNPSDLQSYRISFNPSPNQTFATSYEIRQSGSNISMGLESNKLLSYSIYDANNNLVPKSEIELITITSLNLSIGALSDDENVEVQTISKSNENPMNVRIVSDTQSGLVPIQIEATIQGQKISLTSSVMVFSGPPSAISLSYSGTLIPNTALNCNTNGVQPAEGPNYCEEYVLATSHAKKIEKWVLTVTDRYNNLVNTNPTISTGMLAGYTQSSAATAHGTEYLYYTPSEGQGVLRSDSTFEVPFSPFSNVDINNDYLVLFGNGYTYDASGKYDIGSIENSKLNLVDAFSGLDTSDLGFAIGHNYRQDPSIEGVEWIGNVYEENNLYQIGDSGSAIINVEYDYYLTGKDVILWTNVIGKNYVDDSTVRIGEAKKITLDGPSISPNVTDVQIGRYETRLVTFYAIIDETEEFYRNANFIGTVEVGYLGYLGGSCLDIGTPTYSTIADEKASMSVVVSSDCNYTTTVEAKDFTIVSEF